MQSYDMTQNEVETIIELAIEIAFEAGCWMGQVELEEHFDRSQYGQVVLEAIKSRKTTMPELDESINKSVMIQLRSDKWREEVKKDSKNYLEKAKHILLNVL